MNNEIRLDAAYRPSDDVVAREIEGELIIIPITSGIGDLEDELYTLNETGKAVWKRLDGQKPLSDIIADLGSEFEATGGEIGEDVLGLLRELLKRKIIVETKRD